MWRLLEFGIGVTQGLYDVWEWEAHYSPERWDVVDEPYREPDLDGTRKSEVSWCGMPDGGVSWQAWQRGWDPEVGSDEEIAFLAAVAVKETEDVDVHSLDYAMRSHMLLGVLRTACETEVERERLVENLRQRFAETGRLEEDIAEPWVRQAMLVMEPYVQTRPGWLVASKDRSALLQQILVENGQLFGRWKLAPLSKEFDFKLGPKK